MHGPEIQYHCESCGQIGARNQLRRDAWGDAFCPACQSRRVVRYRSKAATLYSLFFLFKVY